MTDCLGKLVCTNHSSPEGKKQIGEDIFAERENHPSRATIPKPDFPNTLVNVQLFLCHVLKA